MMIVIIGTIYQVMGCRRPEMPDFLLVMHVGGQLRQQHGKNKNMQYRGLSDAPGHNVSCDQIFKNVL